MSQPGKKRNALKHGANARAVMLWSEKYEDYEALRAGLYQEWFPQGKTEEHEVNALLGLLWRRQRLVRAEPLLGLHVHLMHRKPARAKNGGREDEDDEDAEQHVREKSAAPRGCGCESAREM